MKRAFLVAIIVAGACVSPAANATTALPSGLPQPLGFVSDVIGNVGNSLVKLIGSVKLLIITIPGGTTLSAVEIDNRPLPAAAAITALQHLKK